MTFSPECVDEPKFSFSRYPHDLFQKNQRLKIFVEEREYDENAIWVEIRLKVG